MGRKVERKEKKKEGKQVISPRSLSNRTNYDISKATMVKPL